MRKPDAQTAISRLDWVSIGCFAATILAWALIDLGTETQLQWLNESAFIPTLGLVMPVAGLITGSVAFLRGRRARRMQPAFLMGACSPLVAIVGFIVGLAIAMARFEAVIYTGP